MAPHLKCSVCLGTGRLPSPPASVLSHRHSSKHCARDSGLLPRTRALLLAQLRLGEGLARRLPTWLETLSGWFPSSFPAQISHTPIVPDAAHPHRTLGTIISALPSLVLQPAPLFPLLGSNTETRLLPESGWHRTSEAEDWQETDNASRQAFAWHGTVRAAGRSLPAPCPRRPSPQTAASAPSSSLLFPQYLPPLLLLFVSLGVVFVFSPFHFSTFLPLHTTVIWLRRLYNSLLKAPLQRPPIPPRWAE